MASEFRVDCNIRYFWVDPVGDVVGVLMTQHMVGFDLPEGDFWAVVHH